MGVWYRRGSADVVLIVVPGSPHRSETRELRHPLLLPVSTPSRVGYSHAPPSRRRSDVDGDVD